MDSKGVLLEIFASFSAQALSKFKLVSKECKELAAEDYFVRKHCRKMMSKDDKGFFLQPHSAQQYNDKVELLPIHPDELSDGIPPNSLEFLSSTSRILASSNGLLLCRDARDSSRSSIFLCNPVTETWLSVPSPDGLNQSSDLKTVFECKSSSRNFPHDYTLIIFMEQGEWYSNFLCKTYSPQEKIWKENGQVNFGERSINFEMPVFNSDVVHFVSDCSPYLAKESPFYRPYIVTLNITDGTSKFLRLPADQNSRKGLNDDMTNCRLGIFNWGSDHSISFKSICLVKVTKTKCCLWVLADYNSGAWTLILKKRVKAMGFIEPKPTIAGFTVMNGESLLLATAERVYRCDLGAQGGYGQVSFISEHTCGENVVFHSYSNTIRPCGNDAASISTF